MLVSVGKTFSQNKASYWDGDWSLGSVVSSFPAPLWASFLIQMMPLLKWHQIAKYSCGRPQLRPQLWPSYDQIHGTREEFASNLTLKRNCGVVDDFIDIVCGLEFFKTGLLGGIRYIENRNDDIRNDFQASDSQHRGKGINFRALILSAFKPHDG